MIKALCVFAALMSLSGCVRDPNATPQTLTFPGISSAVLIPGDQRLVTVRTSAGQLPVMCEEPTPDYAAAPTVSAALSGTGAAPGGVSADASASLSEADAIVQLAGRSSGIIGLRDAIYDMCLANANGKLGNSAYALILSQYGNLLAALAGANAAAAAPGAPAATATTTAAIAPTTGTGTTSSTGMNMGSGTSASVAIATMQMEAVQALLVSCIANYDHSLPPPFQPDDVLTLDTCQKLTNNIAAASTNLLKPLPAAPAPATAPATAKPGAATAGTPFVRSYQTVLQAAGFYTGAIDGVSGPGTLAALHGYQTAKDLKPTSSPDAATLAAMKLSG